LDLEPDERRALQVAVAAVRPAAGQDALWKLGAEVVDAGAAVTAVVPEVAGLPILREAAARRAAVAFRYHGRDRRLDPYGLLLRGGFWYVVGRDHEHDEVRTYRVDRVEGGVVGSQGPSFERPDGFDLRTAFPADPKRIGVDAEDAVALVRVGAPRAVAVERELGAARVTQRHPDGTIDVEVPCANAAAFRSWLLGLLEHGEVLEPPPVRAEVIAWLEGLAGISS
ncbi:MAG: WYL domain-containing protein, partial [Acidimicrobiia bacterium]|nr:WYL domain-containing protein [Acidimicrobiia bacterium]